MSFYYKLPAPTLSMTVEAEVFDGRGLEDDTYHMTIRGFGGIIFSGEVEPIEYERYDKFFAYTDRMKTTVTRLAIDAWA